MGKAKKEGNKHKRPDTRPARQRYWLGEHLAMNKVRRILKSNARLRQLVADEAVSIKELIHDWRRLRRASRTPWKL